jgi:hypothetical protein
MASAWRERISDRDGWIRGVCTQTINRVEVVAAGLAASPRQDTIVDPIGSAPARTSLEAQADPAAQPAATVGRAELATLGAAGTTSAADQSSAAPAATTQSDSAVCGVDIRCSARQAVMSVPEAGATCHWVSAAGGNCQAASTATRHGPASEFHDAYADIILPTRQRGGVDVA